MAKTMLIADDIALNLAILENIFQAEYKILKALNGRQALDLMAAEEIDIVILDIVMPEVDGFEVLETMKKDPRLADIPVIIATSDVEGNEAKALTLGADDFITKPYNPVVVFKRVENILVKNILEREKLRNALSESMEEFNSLSDSVPGGICVWKVTDQVSVRYFNHGICELLGCTHEEFEQMYKQDLSVVFFGADRGKVMKALTENRKLGQKFSMVHRMLRRDGRVCWVQLSAVHYKTEDDAPIYRVVYIDVTERKENELLVEQRNSELQHMLEYDGLTGIYNRYGFCSRTAQFLERHPESDYVLMQVDIERFKIINELYGMETGDRILKILANCLDELLNDTGICGRLDADHFVLCIPDDESYLGYVRKLLQEKISKVDIKNQITLYFGIYPIGDRKMSVELMCDRANLSLESVKGKYNVNYAVYDERMHQRVLLEQEITDEMVGALQTGQFKVYLQPIVSLEDRRLVSAEALVRWIHPEKGMISPGDFIPFFEKNGFILKLDAYIREEVVKLQSGLIREKRDPVPVSVNISRLELYDPDFYRDLIRLVQKYDLPPALLRLEITENAYTDNPQQLIEMIKALQEYGFEILMDDFGSGYSSLNMLKEVPVDILKLDMKFITGEDIYGREAAILASVIHMARDIGIRTVAEGVETEKQASYLRDMSCDYGQGYHFAKPMPVEQFLKLKHSDLCSTEA